MHMGPRLCSVSTRDSGEAHPWHASQPLYLWAHACTLLLIKKSNIQTHGRAIRWKKILSFSFEKNKKIKECGDIDKFTVNEVAVVRASYRVGKNLKSWIMAMSRRKIGNCWICFFPFTWIRVLHWFPPLSSPRSTRPFLECTSHNWRLWGHLMVSNRGEIAIIHQTEAAAP